MAYQNSLLEKVMAKLIECANVMRTLKKSPNRFAICVNNAGYPASLELHKIYRVLQDDDTAADGDLRIIDESGEDYLYPAEYFVPIQSPQSVEKSLLRAV